MDKNYSTVNEDLDFFEFFERLWDGRWLIGVSVVIAFLLGGSLVLSEDPVFESKIFYQVDTLPAFYENDEVIDDFQKNFYSVSVFDDWKKSNSSGPLIYENLEETKVIDGFFLSKNQSELLATFATSKEGITSIIINTDQLATLDDVFKYAKHINDMLETEYVSRAKDELTFLDTRFKSSTEPGFEALQMAILHNRFITSVENGVSLLKIKNPTVPKKISPRFLLVIVTSGTSGGIIGILLTFFLNAVKTRKERLVKKNKLSNLHERSNLVTGKSPQTMRQN